MGMNAIRRFRQMSVNLHFNSEGYTIIWLTLFVRTNIRIVWLFKRRRF